VHITYDVEIGDAIELKELPFVMGVLGDFTGQPTEPLPRLRDRKFTEVNPDNFDKVLEGMKPHLAFGVTNKLAENADAPPEGGSALQEHGRFRTGERSSAGEAAAELLDLRTKLSDLRGSLQGNDKLEELLLETVNNTEKMKKLKDEVKPDGGSNG